MTAIVQPWRAEVAEFVAGLAAEVDGADETVCAAAVDLAAERLEAGAGSVRLVAFDALVDVLAEAREAQR